MTWPDTSTDAASTRPPGCGTQPAASAFQLTLAFGAMLVIYGLAFFQRTGIPGTIFDELQQGFRLSATAVTALGSVFVYVYAGMQLIAGFSADRYGGRRTLLVGSTIMCVGAFAFPCSESAAMLFASRALIGFGTSFVYLSIVKEVDTLFAPRHFAGLLGLTLLASYAGNIAATLPFERAVRAFGWRHSLLAVACLSLLATIVAWCMLRRLAPVATTRPRMSWRLLWDVLRNARSHGLLVCGLINFPITFVIQAILGKKFLEDAVGLSSAGAAGFLLVMGATCGMAGGLGGPALRLTAQRRKPVILFAVGMILASTSLMWAAVLCDAPSWVFLIAYVLLASSILGSPATLATMKEVNRPEAVAVTISVLNTAVYIGVGVVGNLAGLILDSFAHQAEVTDARIVYPPRAYAVLFATLTLLALVSMFVTLLKIPETRGQPVTLEEIERELA